MIPSVTSSAPSPTAATLVGSSDGAETLPRPASSRSLRADVLARGSMLGRYIVLDVLGRGGMGIVYTAYDPQLDRKVALKLLLPGRNRGPAARIRLQREAQAIARLSHPNVVAVHDVGAMDDQVFIAMELVEGMDLARWQAAERRTRAELLELFFQAGTGLAAAHAAELVHRDFKPENVLVGRDGRARVVDFGLVRKDDTVSLAGASADDLPAEVSQHRAVAHDDALRLTEAGATIGTPAYMSPEQFHGLGGDARTDQFSFCVALYEALYGERPFEGDGLPELAYSVTHGKVRPPPPQHTVPGRLRQVLLRGLAVDPDDRYASMDALMVALRKATTAQRGRWVALGLGVAVPALGVGLVAMGDPREPACAHASDRATLVWSAERRGALQQRFEQTERSYAADTWQRVQAHVDGYVSEWAALQREVCEANRGLDPQVAAEDPRQRCLDERMDHVDDLLAIFEQAEARTVARAVPLVHGLDAVKACADVDAHTALPIPSEPALREQVAALRGELRRMEAEASAGIHGLDEAELAALAKQAEALGYAPFVAELQAVQAGLAADRGEYDRAVELANLAFETTLASRHDLWAYRVATELLFLHGVERRETTEAHRWGRRAAALGKRLGDDPTRRMQLLSNWASVYAVAGDDAQARAHYDEALGIVRELDEPLNLANVLNNMGAFHAQGGRPDEAQPYLEEAAARHQDLLGPDHPTTLRTQANLGVVAVMAGRHAEGRALLEAVLPRQEASLGPDHAEVAVTLEALASAALRRGELDTAEGMRRRVLQIRLGVHGPRSQPVLSAKINLVGVLIVRRRYDEAHALSIELLGELDAARDADPRSRVPILENLAMALEGLERFEEASSRAQEGLALCRDGSCTPSQTLALLTTLGQTKLAGGDRVAARAAFEEALALPRARHEHDTASARFGLAKLVLDDDRAAALAMARQARDEVLVDDVHSQELQRSIEAWLRAHE